jgi:small neutral amino acid transporter SnatA (MarC family)
LERQRVAAFQAVCVAGGVIALFALFGQTLLDLLGRRLTAPRILFRVPVGAARVRTPSVS